MAITGQFPISDILTTKDFELAYQPLLLVEIGPFPDKKTLYLASENLDGTDQGFPYKGHDYKPRILNSDPGSIQAISDNGIVQSPQITLELADADNFLWTQWEKVDGRGMKGRRVVVRFVFWDPGTTDFSTDERYVFTGICNPPVKSATVVTLTAVSLLNMTKSFVPPVRIQRRCPWAFPSNQADRALGAVDEDSDFFQCGYSPDVDDSMIDGASAAARGNNDPTTGAPFIECPRTWDACIDRMGNRSLPDHSTSSTTFVQIERDHAGRPTARFGGIRWDAPDGWKGRAFESGNVEEGINNPNVGKYNDYFPFVYGTAFVEPPVMNVCGDPNSTRFETVLCFGKIWTDQTKPGPVRAVLVNDFWIPHSSEATDPLLSWDWVTTGDRTGGVNRIAIYDGRGDCYGSLACIVITVYRKIHDSTDPPRLRVLTSGPAIRNWGASGDPADVLHLTTKSPVWTVADLLTWAGWKATDLSLDTWFIEAAYCLDPVTYTNLTGTEVTHPRYEIGLALRERTSISEVLRLILAGFKAILRPNSLTGKLEILIKKTLADQQPQFVPGSNSMEAVASIKANGEHANGFVAYDFNESNIIWENNAPTLKIDQRPISDTPNRLACEFQDEDYFYVNDSVVQYDDEDIGRIGQQIGGTISMLGVISYDQCLRAIQTQFAEQFRGNPRTGYLDKNDTGGTWIFELKTTFRVIHLRVGDIVGMTFPRYGIETQILARVIALTPTSNCEFITVRAQLHEDDWYLDTYGQNPSPLFESQRRHNLLRPPFGWLPNQEAPWSGDQMFDPTEKTFALSQWYEAAADGTSITSIRVIGKVPVNKFSDSVSPPYAPSATYTGGGTLKAGAYWFALCAVDANGLLTPPSWPLAKLDVPADASAAQLVNIYWDSGTVGWKFYAGSNPNKLSLQSSGSGTPPTVSFTDYQVAAEAMPDIMFSYFRFKLKHVWHSGVFGAAITDITATTITVAGAGWTEGQWIGRDASVLGQRADFQILGVWDFRVLRNTSEVLTFDSRGGTLDLTGLGIKIGDAVVMRSYAKTVSANTIGDPEFVNSIKYASIGIPVYAVSNNGDEVAIVTTVPNDLQTGDIVTASGILGNTAANTTHAIDVYEPSAFTFPGVIGNGDYEGGGIVQQVTNGLEPNAEKGRLVRIIAGKGRGQVKQIVSNDSTTLTIDGVWDVVPDATSAFVIEDSAWLTTSDTSPFDNSDPTREVIADVKTNNFLEEVIFVQAFTVSADGRESVDGQSPLREIYLFGDPGGQNIDFVTPTFILGSTSVGDTKTNLIPIRRKCYAVECTITITKAPLTAISFDIRCKRISDGSIASIFAAPLTIPSTTVQYDVLKFTTFRTDPMQFFVDDVLGFDITASGDSTALFTAVVKCHLGEPPAGL